MRILVILVRILDCRNNYAAIIIVISLKIIP